MESARRTPAPSLSTASSYGSCRAAPAAPEQFPAGLRVLVVDDDVVCLRILEQMLQRCQYRVTTCCQATIALSLLRERKDDYDVVISDVHMPDMDGFKLLELVGLEMDLPVIMMSADGRTSIVLKGIKHGACDYLIKPVRIEELKNIWQHVVRKKRSENKEPEHSGSFDDSDRHPRAVDDTDYASSVIEGTDGSRKSQRKRRDAKEEEDDGELDSEDPSASKKARVVWSVELHQQFVSAVNQLGIDKAVPKRILELMNVPGLTRENVASHLQKFRMYLKRLSGVAQHQNGLPNSFFVHMEPNAKMGSLGSADFQALVASGQNPPQTLAALHAELLGRPSGSLILPEMDQTAPLQALVHGPRSTPMEAGVDFGQYQSNKTEQLHLSNIAFDGISSGFSVSSSNHLGTLKSMRNLGGVGDTQNDNMLVRLLPQQQVLPVLSESHNAVNVQPSCLVVSPQSSGSFQLGNSRFPLNQNSRTMPPHLAMNFQIGTTSIPQNSKCNNGRVVSYSSHSLESNGILGIGQVSDGGFKNFGVLNGHTSPGSLSSPLSVCSTRNGRSTGLMAHNSIMNPCPASKLPGDSSNLCILDSEANIAQGHGRNLGFVGKATCISSRFAVDDIPPNNLSNKKARVHEDAERVKQELYFDFKDVSNFSSSVLPHFSANDVTGVLSKY